MTAGETLLEPRPPQTPMMGSGAFAAGALDFWKQDRHDPISEINGAMELCGTGKLASPISNA